MNVTPEQKKVGDGAINNESRAEIHDRTGLFVSIAALAIAFLSSGLWIATAIFGPALMDAKVERGAARAEALAELARKEASTAKDIVDIEKSKVQAYQDLTKELKNANRR